MSPIRVSIFATLGISTSMAFRSARRDHFDQVFELGNTNVVIVSEADSREQFERIFRICAG